MNKDKYDGLFEKLSQAEYSLRNDVKAPVKYVMTEKTAEELCFIKSECKLCEIMNKNVNLLMEKAVKLQFGEINSCDHRLIKASDDYKEFIVVNIFKYLKSEIRNKGDETFIINSLDINELTKDYFKYNK